MKLKILGSPLPSNRVDDVEMEMDTLGPPQTAATAGKQRKKSRVSMLVLVMVMIMVMVMVMEMVMVMATATYPPCEGISQ